MAFQPFGYHIEIRSNLTPSEVKQRLREKKVSWFEPKNGPRGWIIGPFLCPWISFWDRHGPMVLARISRDDFGSRVTERAGSDLNGLLYMIVLLPFLAFLFFKMTEQDASVIPQLVLIGLFLITGFGFMLWFGHTDKRQAGPLIQFIRSTVAQNAATSVAAKISGQPVQMSVNGDQLAQPPSASDVRSVLATLVVGDFLILSRTGQDYIQTAMRDDGLVLEKREGGANSHFSAQRDELSTQMVEAALFAFMENRHDSSAVV